MVKKILIPTTVDTHSITPRNRWLINILAAAVINGICVAWVLIWLKADMLY